MHELALDHDLLITNQEKEREFINIFGKLTIISNRKSMKQLFV